MQGGASRAPGRRRGQSLLEVVAAATIIAVALVPALRMMRDSLKVSRDIETAELMTTLAVSKLEEQMALSSATWSLAAETGNYASLGRSDVRFDVTKTDADGAGGVPDALMVLTVTVWSDKNGNAGKDGNEPGVTFATKISKLLGYQNQSP
jgi:hypothetical protein